MAFLDNSGDIILDAVLTDLGRKRMAEGNFRITQFALGDDEVDYSLYNKDHPSGSAYYDLEILQTPVFEAFTSENANINYGLLTLDGNTDLFYLPTLIANEKSAPGQKSAVKTSGVVYLAVNNTTFNTLTATGGGLTDRTCIEQGQITQNFSFETGINNNNDPAGGEEERLDYLVNTGLLDNDFTLMCDGRFLTAVHPMDPGSTFSYRKGMVGPEISIQLKATGLAPLGGAAGVVGRRTYLLPSIDNLVEDQDAGSSATTVSEISGPRGRLVAFTFGVSPDLKADKDAATPSKFSLYGRKGVSAADLEGVTASGTFDIIDTIVYLNGNTTGANTQLIVRIIRQAS